MANNVFAPVRVYSILCTPRYPSLTKFVSSVFLDLRFTLHRARNGRGSVSL